MIFHSAGNLFAAKNNSNKQLFEELKKNSALSSKKKNMEKLSIFHLACSIEPMKEDSRANCVAYKSPVIAKKNRINFNKTRSESFFKALSASELHKGEGGIFVEFLSCEKNIAGDESYFSCVASMPIGEEK